MNLQKFEKIINESFDDKEKINIYSDKSIIEAINEKKRNKKNNK